MALIVPRLGDVVGGAPDQLNGYLGRCPGGDQNHGQGRIERGIGDSAMPSSPPSCSAQVHVLNDHATSAVRTSESACSALEAVKTEVELEQELQCRSNSRSSTARL
jgi:hypothetical protein